MGANQYTNPWTDDQIELLNEIYPDKSTSVEMLENVFERKIKAIRAKANRVGLIRKRQYDFDENYFQEIDSEEKAYFLGFIVADGNVWKNRLKIYIHSKDRDILECLVGELRCNKPFYETKRYGDTYLELALYSDKLISNLAEKDITEQKSKTVEFPHIEERLIRHFIRGYFDGDGCISKCVVNDRGKSRVRYAFDITCGSKKLIYAIYTHLSHASCLNFKVYEKNGNYRISTSNKKNLINFHEFLYRGATVFGKRKKQIFDNFMVGVGLHPLRCIIGGTA